MQLKMITRSYRRIGLIGLTAAVFAALTGCHSPFKPKALPPFGYHALKINGKFIGPEVFFKEQGSFYMRWRRNAEMLHKSDEERTNMMLEEIIDHAVTDDYLYHHCGITVAPQEVDEYISRYIKPKFASPGDWRAFMQNSGYKTDADLKKNIEIYLLRLKCFSKMAKDSGMTVAQKEMDTLYQKHMDENYKAVVRHILVSGPDSLKAKQQAAELYRQLQSGADFGALAKQYSSDEESKSAGGMQPPISRAEALPQVAECVFKAKPGDLPPPFKTLAGYEIIQVDRFVNFCHPKAEFIDMTLMEKFGNSALYKAWIAGIKSKATIEILDPAMKAYRLYRDGSYDRAAACYEQAFRQRRYEPFLQRAIDSFRKAKNWTKMVELCRAGIKKYPERITYDIFRAEGLYRNGRVSDAMELMKSAEIRCRGSVYFKESIIEMYDTLGLAQEANRMRESPSK